MAPTYCVRRPMRAVSSCRMLLIVLVIVISFTLAQGNNPPRLINFQGFARAKENSAIGTVIYSITATDQDGPDAISFVISSDSVETSRLVELGNATGNSKTGRSVDIKLKVGDLDRDFNPPERYLVFEVLDGSNAPVLARVTLFIEDVNDCAPEFRQVPYRASILEDALNSSLVFNGTETYDPDQGLGGSVTYRLETTDAKYKHTFLVSLYSGFLHVNESLDYEKVSFYRLILRAIDGGGLNSTTDVIISVEDVQDTPPYFVNLPYRTRVFENASLGSSVLAVSALDGDKGRPNPITYTFKGNTHNDTFKINSTTGLISVNKDLDSDHPDIRAQGSVIDLTVLAAEINESLPQKGVTTASTLVTIYIDDVNDNIPTFDKNSYSATVPENTPNGIAISLADIITVEDIDQGVNSKFSLSLQLSNGVAYDVFNPAPSTIFGKATVLIYVKNSTVLDYEALTENGGQPTLNFTILAEEMDTPEKWKGIANVTVTVIDVNDHYPEFVNSSYEAHLPENAAIDETVIQITATDKDSGIFGEITYTLTGGSNMFRVDSTNGIISVDRGGLDRDNPPDRYYLNLEARDGGGLPTQVQLTVILIDVNDNPPVFQLHEYSGYIFENSATFLRPVVLKATDLDEGLNGKVRYRISDTPGNLGNNFTINDTTGELGVVTPLDFEELAEGQMDSLTIQVMAYDLGNPPLNNTVNVVITVEDVNDNKPIFFPDVYSTNMEETAMQKYFVTSISATDADGKEPNNKIYYGIQRGGQDKFLMDANAGNLTVSLGATFDRDKISQYVLTVVAIDRGTPPETGTATVTINITDVNNKPPVFSPASVTTSVRENMTVGTPVLTFTATDPDDDHRLEYEILMNDTIGHDENGNPVDLDVVKDYFDVRRDSGEIYIKSELDRETAEVVVIKVLVTDKNAVVKPETQTATGTVTITLLDYNDHPPDFSKPYGYNLSISEETALNSVVLRFSASDKDKDQSIKFGLHDPSTKFSIDDPTASIVKLLSSLDREKNDHHEFIITATDNGAPPLSANATVWVKVEDANDNTPQFVEVDLKVTILEDRPVGTSVANISATDADIGDYGEVHYFFKSGSDGKFEINSTTGEITVKLGLNREEKEVYSIQVEAQDNMRDPNPSKRNSNQTSITITLEDVNDNDPSFNGTTFYVPGDVEERREVGVQVYQLQATDPDKDLNGKIVYSLNSSATNATENGQALFRIDDDSGAIFVAKSLVNNVGWRYMTVVATDKGTPPRSASATVFVFIRDENIHTPVFVKPETDPKRIYRLEEQGANKLMYTVSAMDKDQGQNGQVEYSLVEQFGIKDHLDFTLDPNSGNLVNNENLDYETKILYSLFIKAQDKGVPVLSHVVRLDIEVVDIDDHPPEFDSIKYPRDRPYNMYAVEEKTQMIGSVGFAEDKDSGNHSIICYCFVGDHTDFKMNITSGEIDLINKIDRETDPGPRQLVVQAIQFCDSCDSVSRKKRAVDTPPDRYNQSDNSMLWVQVNIVDINDNPPVFTRKDLSVGITRDTQYHSEVMRLADVVTDADQPGNNTVHQYSIVGEIKGVGEKLDTSDPPFVLSHTGILLTNTYFQADMFGHYTMKILVKDVAGDDEADLKVFLINNDQQVKIIIRGTPEEVSSSSKLLVAKLENVTGGIYDIIIDKIQTHEDEFGKPQVDKTDLFIHGVDRKTKEVIPGAELLRAIDSKIHLLIETYKKYNVIEILPAVSQAKEDTTLITLKMALILVAILLGMLIVVLGFTFYICRRTYKRKLRAATAMAFGAKESEMSKTDMPGTNLHAFEGSNPIWMEKYENPGFKDDDSQNSLDANIIEATPQNTYDEQEVSMDLYNDDYDHYNKVPPSKLSTSDIYLNAAIKEHESSKNSKNNDLANNNAAKYAVNGSIKYSNGSLDGTFSTQNINGLQTTEI